MGISRDEWLTALNDAGFATDPGDSDAVTADELAAELCISRHSARHKLQSMVVRGLARRTVKAITTTDGKRMRGVGYRLVSKKAKKR